MSTTKSSPDTKELKMVEQIKKFAQSASRIDEQSVMSKAGSSSSLMTTSQRNNLQSIEVKTSF